jgi:uncharacterized membrane protein
MAWFEGSHRTTFTVPASVEATKAHFADPATIVANTEHVESHTIEDDGTVHFVLAEQDHTVVKFKGDYRSRYVLDGDTLVWTAEGGNTEQSGKATFTADGDGTRVDYEETVRVDLDLPAMMVPMAKPLIGPMVTHEIKEYLSRMQKGLA